MSMINIKDLYSEKQQREKNKTDIYEKVLKMCHKKIQRAVKIDPYTESYFFIIPRYIYGVPLYKLDECLKYLVEHLSQNGFKLYYTHPNLLLISWKKEVQKKEEKPKENINIVKPEKQSYKSIYNTDILDKFNKKTLSFN